MERWERKAERRRMPVAGVGGDWGEEERVERGRKKSMTHGARIW
jgi:hypothetical protein